MSTGVNCRAGHNLHHGILASADTTAIGSITKDIVGESVKVCGTISKMYVSNKENIFFNLNDSASISVVVFRDKAELFDAGSMKNGMTACVDGTVQIIMISLRSSQADLLLIHVNDSSRVNHSSGSSF